MIKWWYRVLHTNQMQKKHKTWKDGFLFYLVASRKAVLVDENGKTLESLQPVNAGDLQGGRELVMESFVVVVDGDPIEEPTFQRETNSKEETAPAPKETDKTSHLNLIMYSLDRNKKNKVWKDGYMSYDAASQIALFYSEERKVLLKKKCSAEKVMDGAIIDTATCIIEVTNAIDSVPSNDLKSPVQELQVEYDCDLSEDEPCFQLLYTEDKHKKSKKWKDGHFLFHRESGMTKFFDETGKLMFKRGLAWKQIDQQEEVETGRFILQLGQRQEAAELESLKENLDPPLKRAQVQIGALSQEDLDTFIEHAIMYSKDFNKKNKKWLEGHLWYENGVCKIFDEEGKQIFKKNCKAADISDGQEFKSGQYLISVGAEKHRHSKSASMQHQEEKPDIICNAGGRSASQLASFFKRHN